MPIWVIIIVFVLSFGIFTVITYNSLVKSKIRVNESFATMDVYLKQRWDLIPNLVEVVKGYAKYEKKTLERIISLRSNNYENLKIDEKLDTNKYISNEITKIFFVSESYPELKTNQSFLKLQDSLTKIETNIAQARKYYNATIREYNIKVNTIPCNIVAKLYKFKPLSMFEIGDEQKQNVETLF